VIRSFRGKDAEAIWQRRYVKRISPELCRLAYNKLTLIDAAGTINDVRVPPGNRLEKLSGDRAGQCSMRVNTNGESASPGAPAERPTSSSSTTTRKGRTMADFSPTHPGEILMTEFLEPMGITQYRIAKAIDVPARRINEIVHGKRAITADTALRLSRALGLSDMFFINMQARYEAEIAREKLAAELGTIERIA
jgi:antitoxin HigA-1